MPGFGDEYLILRGPSGVTNLGSGPDASYVGGGMTVVPDTDSGGVSAFRFDGASWISAGTIDVTSWTQCSWGMWLKIPGQARRSFSLYHSGTLDDIRIYTSSHVAVDDGTARQVSLPSMTGSSWVLVVGTFDGSTVRGYHNGSLIGSVSGTFNFATADGATAIGNGAVGTTHILISTSLVDDARFSNTVWSDAQIAAWYAAGRGYDAGAAVITKRRRKSAQKNVRSTL